MKWRMKTRSWELLMFCYQYPEKECNLKCILEEDEMYQ